ncbi:MAG: hypothetical protein ACREP2_00960 [Rhodanobacteraceae bacterium]
MSFVDMNSEEWEEVRRHHDEMVQMGRLELQTEEIRDHRPCTADIPVERRLCEFDDLVISASH